MKLKFGQMFRTLNIAKADNADKPACPIGTRGVVVTRQNNVDYVIMEAVNFSGFLPLKSLAGDDNQPAIELID